MPRAKATVKVLHPEVIECPSCEAWTGTKDCPLCHGDGHVDILALAEAAELLAELVRSDQVMGEQAEEACIILARCGTGRQP